MSGLIDNIKNAASSLLGGDNKSILDALKKMTPDEIKNLAPDDEDSQGTFGKIVGVVENAVNKNESKTDLISNLMSLGSKALAMAKNIPVLSKLLGS